MSDNPCTAPQQSQRPSAATVTTCLIGGAASPASTIGHARRTKRCDSSSEGTMTYKCTEGTAIRNSSKDSSTKGSSGGSCKRHGNGGNHEYDDGGSSEDFNDQATPDNADQNDACDDEYCSSGFDIACSAKIGGGDQCSNSYGNRSGNKELHSSEAFGQQQWWRQPAVFAASPHVERFDGQAVVNSTGQVS